MRFRIQNQGSRVRIQITEMCGPADGTRIRKLFADAVVDAIYDVFADADADTL